MPLKLISNGQMTASPNRGTVYTGDEQKPGKIDLPNGLHNYSTEEQVVGTWIDGKPIYEKTFVDFQLVHNTRKCSYSYNLNIPDGDKSIKLEFLDQCVVGQPRPFAGIDYPVGGWINYIDNQIHLTIETGTDRSNMVISFVLQYTKTTD